MQRPNCPVAGTQNMTRLAKYSQELYSSLEEKTGVATGFRQNGSITVALTMHGWKNYAEVQLYPHFGVEIDEVNPADIASHYRAYVSDAKGGGILQRMVRRISELLKLLPKVLELKALKSLKV